MDKVTRVPILDKAVCISHSANTLGKGLNLIYSLSSQRSILGRQVGSLILVEQTVWEKENYEFKPIERL